MGAALRAEDQALAYVIERVSALVHEVTGVQFGSRQRPMVESRMKKRILDLRLSSFAEYARHLDQNEALEVEKLVSLLTTHHTYFFREFYHFEFIEQNLAQIVAESRARGSKNLRVLCAACSRGQEVYSLASFLNRHLPMVAPDFTFSILGVDVDPESVEFSRNAVYETRETKSIPNAYLTGSFVQGQGDVAGYVKVRENLRSRCEFRTGNLMEADDLAAEGTFDLIFCRNVFIYFSSQQIQMVTRNLTKSLAERGRLFIGISESLNGLDVPLASVGSSIYQRPATKGARVTTPPPTAATPTSKRPAPIAVATMPVPTPAPGPLRVLCVDDSPSILTLLGKILTKDRGFEVVATAKNGLEAAEVLRTTKVDVMTLDIHMPQMTGVEYLAKHFGSQHPPVVMVSSVGREEQDLAFRALQLGAADYVEKPALHNMLERGDEIRTKLKCAVRAGAPVAKRDLSLEKAFAKSTVTVTQPERKLLVAVLAGAAQAPSLKTVFDERGPGFPPAVIVIDGLNQTTAVVARRLSDVLRAPVEAWTPGSSPRAGAIYLADAKAFDQSARGTTNATTSVLIWRDVSPALEAKVLAWPRGYLLVEDDGSGGRQPLAGRADDVVPATSFIYMCRQRWG